MNGCRYSTTVNGPSSIKIELQTENSAGPGELFHGSSLNHSGSVKCSIDPRPRDPIRLTPETWNTVIFPLRRILPRGGQVWFDEMVWPVDSSPAKLFSELLVAGS